MVSHRSTSETNFCLQTANILPFSAIFSCMCIEAIKKKSSNQKCYVVKCSFCKSLIFKLYILLHSHTFLIKQHHSRLNYLTRKRLFTFAWRLYKKNLRVVKNFSLRVVQQFQMFLIQAIAWNTQGLV